MDITAWIWMKLVPNLTLYFVHNVCNWQEFDCVSTRPLRPYFSALVCDHLVNKNISFLQIHFEEVITIFWTIWTIYYATLSFWFYPIADYSIF